MIKVEVKTDYVAEQSVPEKNQFVYAYTIRITNEGEEAAQLISRHWVITDANNSVQEVQGQGVIGEQPLLGSNEVFTYTSGVVMETLTGTMSGTYTMRKQNGDEFITDIPTFALVQPSALH